MLRFARATPRKRWGETSGRSPLTGIELGRRRSREVRTISIADGPGRTYYFPLLRPPDTDAVVERRAWPA